MRTTTRALMMVLVLTGLVIPRSIRAAEQTQAVSMIQLISNPGAYDGKLIQVVGFVRFEEEGSALYLHEEDYKRGLAKNGVWLSMNEQKELDQKYALIEGVFNAHNRGHMGLWSGSIEKVNRSILWPPKRS